MSGKFDFEGCEGFNLFAGMEDGVFMVRQFICIDPVTNAQCGAPRGTYAGALHELALHPGARLIELLTAFDGQDAAQWGALVTLEAIIEEEARRFLQ
jgi:hypothetical protein